MKSRLAAAAGLCMLSALTLGACPSDGNRLYKLEHRRLLHAEGHIRKAEGEIRRLQRERRAQAIRISRLVKELARMRRALQRARGQSHRRIVPPPPRRRVIPRTPGVISVSGIRFWDRRNRKLRKAVRAELTRLMPRFEHCYRRLGWGRVGEPPLREKFWVLFGVRRKVVGNPRINGSSLRQRGNTAPTRRHLTRALTLESCMRQVLRGVRLRHKSIVRVAVLVSAADTQGALKKIKAPAFKWPWKRVTRRRSGPGQVCRVGSRHRFDLLTPRVARPCRKGLRCCYPCGIAGCDSRCMRRCPRGLP